MPRKPPELSAIVVSRIRAPGYHSVGEVAGLMLQVTETGGRSWILRATVGARRREIGLGAFPEVTLATAREQARVMRSKIAVGVDPIEERRAARTALSAVLTFDEAARRLIASKSPEWKNAKHKDQWTNTLKTYASPTLGKLPIGSIEIRHVVDVLEPMWVEKTETATRVRSRIEAVLGWATVSGHRTGANPARWRGNLDLVLPKPGKVRKVKHHAALPFDAMPDFIAALRAREGFAPRALEFAILTAARSNEVRGASWEEVDTESHTWTIPANRMKAGKAHKVPLSARALAILEAVPRLAHTRLIFPAPSGKPMSDMALLQVMKRMKVDAVPHGFRSTFRDWAAERTNHSRDVAEMALAHTIGAKVEAAYRRGDLFAKRTKLMADWARFIETMPAKGNVTPIRRKTG